MKKRLFIIGLAMMFAVPVFAELTVDDTVSRDYLYNHGYSPAIINSISKNVAEINGEPLEEPVEKAYYNNPCVKFIRRVFMYLDPGLDSHTFKNNYRIKPTPRYDELN